MRYLLNTLIIGIITMTFPHYLSGQGHDGKFGNEWINYNLTYYKIQVTSDGMHRVTGQVLQNAGMDITQNAANFRMFHLGKEVPIHVERTGNAVEYIQFYGQKNRGEYDVHLYDQEHHHFNPEYSLITDTSAYFLTWDASTTGRQFTTSGANLSNLPAAEQYYMHENKKVYSGKWNQGKKYRIATEQLTTSAFEYAEGYGLGPANGFNANVSTPHKYATGPDATAKIKVYGFSQVSHNLEISVNGTTYVSSYFVSDSIKLHQFTLPTAQIGASLTAIRVDGTGGSADLYDISFASIKYPRTFNFENQTSFKFGTTGAARKYFVINDFDGSNNSTTSDIYLYDLTSNLRIQCLWNSGSSQVLTDLPAGSVGERELVLVNEAVTSGVQNVVNVVQTTFIDFSTIGYLNRDYVIITHPILTKTSSGSNPILEYEAYRASSGFIPVTVYIQQLYDQFAYGINNHPLAVRHFAHYIKRTWANPEYIFIIGKGRGYQNVRNETDLLLKSLLVPTMGYPPSDNKMLSYIGRNTPAIPVGRLAATRADQVELYLSKIKALEGEQQLAYTLPDRGWMKNILHLGGGSNSNEQNIIKLHLNNMKSIAEGLSYGGNVESFFKTSASPIQAAQSSFLDSLINSGVSMITFFGHSSASSFDFNLDYPSNYSNKDRYPLIMALGCYGGTISGIAPAISEAFVFEEEAGASVFLASTGAAALSALNQFANKFYRQMSGDSYGEGAAKMVQKAIEDLEQGVFTTTIQMVSNYITYHGDPALKLNAQSCTDYYIDETLVSHSPEVVTIQQDSFAIELDLYNLGKAIDTVFYVNILREYNDGTTETVVQKQVVAPYFTGKYKFSIATGGLEALELNKFTITIDANDDINECGETNNLVLEYYIYILSDAILPIYPYEFAIVPDQNITLKASTGNAFALPQTYRVQMDTTAYFNSPLMLETTITQGGGVVEWTPATTYLDSTVYYWRVSPDSINPQTGFQWAQSSFIHIGGSYPGWNQSHFFQYLRDDHTSIEIKEPNREFQYIKTIQDISVRNGYVNPNLTSNPIIQDYLSLYFNSKQLDKCRCRYEDGLYVTVVDPVSLDVWNIPAGVSSKYGAINCDGALREASTFLFETDLTAGKNALERFLRDTIPNGHYVMIHTLNNAYAQFWQSSLVNLLKDEGAQHLDDLRNDPLGLPYAFFYKKGDSTYTHKKSIIGPNRETEIELLGVMQEEWFQGKQTSTVIGPASNWGSFHWRTSSLDALPTDAVTVDIYGINATQTTQTLLMSDLTALDTFLNTIDAQQYPYLQLVWNTSDATNKTSLQLDYWRILADMMPEAALRPDIYYSLQSDSIQQGVPIALDITMENISDVDMDSMLVYYSVVGTSPPIEKYVRMAPLPAGDTLVGHVTLPTNNLDGNQLIYVEINPNDDQLEKHHFNNYGFLQFNITKDIINPILDVTFDGVHIMNGDIVSGKPEIAVYLTDENKSLALNDMEDFQVILQYPNGVQQDMLDGTVPLQFYPADAGRVAIENKARIVTNPDLDQDGTYTLFVSATDRSGNNSGDLNYSVDFEVINKASISNVLNYPNPFTTSTQFVFTLTGREIPDYMKIQILTVSGKIVKEIGMEELGPIRVGVNRTEYAWDGTDQFGDQLANGVYLYRVITQRNGETYERYNSNIDYMFRRGFGKMYLMR